MTPREYEELVAAYFRAKGYEVQLTPYSNDYGIDVLASRGSQRVAVQARMFGDTARKINRQMVMELHGAKDFGAAGMVAAQDGLSTRPGILAGIFLSVSSADYEY